MQRSARLVFAALCVMVGGLPAGGAIAQDGPSGLAPVGPPTDYVVWTATTEPSAVRPGDAARVVLAATIDEGWKMYAPDSPRPSRGVVVTRGTAEGPLTWWGGLQRSAPEEGYDPYFDATLRYYYGRATLRTAVRVAPDAAAGTYAVSGTVEFMICSPKFCLPPTPVPFETSLVVDPSAAPSGVTLPADTVGMRSGGR